MRNWIMSTVKNLKVQTLPATGSKETAAVIFLHGSGDTGPNFIEWIRFLLGKDMEFPHIKLVFPTAPAQPYTPNNKQLSNVWFDRLSISNTAKESRKSLASAYKFMKELIDLETQSGIPPHRIIVGGFSMGGALALHTGYHVNREIGGVFAMSSFLNRESIVYESLNSEPQSTRKLPQLLMFHGELDDLVPLAWGQETYDNLTNIGVKGNFIKQPNTYHELKKKELLQLKDWILNVLPPVDNGLLNKL